ncbi:porin family protein [Flavobacterium sp. '19STA2R22 D10 B1']|uniref:porin family protein n=1 Tax=Flavobacterium aerium TaxID=3037261 RepID=UPI00278BF6D5|nr:porin family protein [Flavobacterium sp. '19STA2R22 D10 B1']
MHKHLYILLFFCFFHSFAQDTKTKKQISEAQELHEKQEVKEEVEPEGVKIEESDADKEKNDSITIKVNDPKYREDQFYAGLTYNLLQNRPDDVTQNSFSYGIHFGFLRDMPINERRTFAIALGLGYSMNFLKQNMLIHNENGENTYFLPAEGMDVGKNKISLHYLEVPLEFRWRTSTPKTHRFWRIYTGLKLSYLIGDKAQFSYGEVNEKITGNPDLNKMMYGAYVSFGYNTWNFHVYYGLNPLFKSGTIGGKSIDMNTVNLGLIFYIL